MLPDLIPRNSKEYRKVNMKWYKDPEKLWGVTGIAVVFAVMMAIATFNSFAETDARNKDTLATIDGNNQKLLNDFDMKLRAALADQKPDLMVVRVQQEPVKEDTEETYLVTSLRELDYMACMAMVKFDLKPSYMDKIQKAVRRYSKECQLPADLVYAVIEKESGFNQYEKSYADCYGLMQINLNVWQRELPQITGEDYLYDIENNIKCGCYILSKYCRIAAIEFPDADHDQLVREALKSYFGKCQQAERYAHKVLTIRSKYQAVKED